MSSSTAEPLETRNGSGIVPVRRVWMGESVVRKDLAILSQISKKIAESVKFSRFLTGLKHYKSDSY